MKTLGEFQSTLQISVIIIVVVPQRVFVGLPSDPEVNLHFLSLQKSRGNSCWPKALVIGHRGPEIGVFSQLGADGDSVCALQVDKSLGGGEDRVEWMGDHCCCGRSHLLRLSGPGGCSPQASWGFERSACLSQWCTAILGKESLRNLKTLAPAWPGTREKLLGQPLTAQPCQQLIPQEKSNSAKG